MARVRTPVAVFACHLGNQAIGRFAFRLGGKAEAGNGGDHEVEGEAWIEPVRSRVGQRADDVAIPAFERGHLLVRVTLVRRLVGRLDVEEEEVSVLERRQGRVALRLRRLCTLAGERGLCIRFDRPVPGIEPLGLLRHPAVTVTVADCDGLAEALNR